MIRPVCQPMPIGSETVSSIAFAFLSVYYAEPSKSCITISMVIGFLPINRQRKMRLRLLARQHTEQARCTKSLPNR